MVLSYNALTAGFQLKLQGAYSYDITLGGDARGNITRIDNALSHIEKDLERSKQVLEDIKVAAVTVNPFSPHGYSFDRDELRSAVQKALPELPVIDVRVGGLDL